MVTAVSAVWYSAHMQYKTPSVEVRKIISLQNRGTVAFIHTLRDGIVRGRMTPSCWVLTSWSGWVRRQPALRCGSRWPAPCLAGTPPGPCCPWCGTPPAGPSRGTRSLLWPETEMETFNHEQTRPAEKYTQVKTQDLITTFEHSFHVIVAVMKKPFLPLRLKINGSAFLIAPLPLRVPLQKPHRRQNQFCCWLVYLYRSSLKKTNTFTGKQVSRGKAAH